MNLRYRTSALRLKITMLSFASLLVLRALAQGDFQGSTHMMPFDEDTIAYSKMPSTGPITELQKRIDSGEVKLEFDEQFGYVKSVLKELKVPLSSQVMVFSKTSLQRERIAPRTPRAVYFNDVAYVGFVYASPLMEITAVDPKLGGVFYTLEQKKVERPKFVRNDQCLECHASAKTMGVPGHLIRSFATDDQGIVDLSTGVSLVNHRTPLAERWGGWYVTGTHGSQAHRGNLIGAAAFERQTKEPNYLGNVTDLSPFFDVTRYPKHQSDIVALMVMEHQSHMHNFLTRLQYEATLAVQQYGHVNYLKNTVTAFLKYLLFTEEVPLTAPVKGAPEFVRDFTAPGPRDKRGRSLRELDFQTRMFKYPCSYLIYSDAFEQLPKLMKDHLYARLWDILNGRDKSPDFQGIPAETRQAIREILVETKSNLPDYWKAERKETASAN